jgi:hypothetical protein
MHYQRISSNGKLETRKPPANRSQWGLLVEAMGVPLSEPRDSFFRWWVSSLSLSPPLVRRRKGARDEAAQYRRSTSCKEYYSNKEIPLELRRIYRETFSNQSDLPLGIFPLKEYLIQGRCKNCTNDMIIEGD